MNDVKKLFPTKESAPQQQDHIEKKQRFSCHLDSGFSTFSPALFLLDPLDLKATKQTGSKSIECMCEKEVVRKARARGTLHLHYISYRQGDYCSGKHHSHARKKYSTPKCQLKFKIVNKRDRRRLQAEVVALAFDQTRWQPSLGRPWPGASLPRPLLLLPGRYTGLPSPPTKSFTTK